MAAFLPKKHPVGSEQVTVTLPASGSAPLEIDSTGKYAVYIISNADFYWTFAVDSTAGNTRIGADATRITSDAGYYELDVEGKTDKLYVKSQGSADTVCYWFAEV